MGWFALQYTDRWLWFRYCEFLKALDVRAFEEFGLAVFLMHGGYVEVGAQKSGRRNHF